MLPRAADAEAGPRPRRHLLQFPQRATALGAPREFVSGSLDILKGRAYVWTVDTAVRCWLGAWRLGSRRTGELISYRVVGENGLWYQSQRTASESDPVSLVCGTEARWVSCREAGGLLIGALEYCCSRTRVKTYVPRHCRIEGGGVDGPCLVGPIASSPSSWAGSRRRSLVRGRGVCWCWIGGDTTESRALNMVRDMRFLVIVGIFTCGDDSLIDRLVWRKDIWG